MLCRPKVSGDVGLKWAADMNKALLTKLAWRLLHDQDAVWSKMVHAKYEISLDAPLDLSYKARTSIIWKRVKWSFELLQQGTRWEVRNEKRTRFWSDRWLVDYLLNIDCALHLTVEDLQLSVALYWEAGRGLSWWEVGDLLSASSLLKLSSVVLNDRTSQRV